MTMWHWLAVMFALLALAYHKQIRTVLSWHPLIIVANAGVLAGAFAVSFGVYFFMVWLREAIGTDLSTAFAFAIVGAFFIICRLATGRWPW